jgi:methylamine dehydrogenase accessory protein MauD
MPVGWAITVVVLCVAVVSLFVVVLGLMRQVIPVLDRTPDMAAAPRMAGPEIGRPLPHFTAAGPDGEFTNEHLRNRPALLLFLSVGCGPCEILAGELRSANLGDLADELVVVTSQEGADKLRLPADLRVMAERDREVARALSVASYPYAVAVDPRGIVKATRVPNTVEHLESLASTLA